MPFALDDLNPAVRFNWDEDGNEWVELKMVPDDLREKFRKEIGIKSKVKFMPNPQTKRMERVDDIDLSEEKLAKLAEKNMDYQISDWHITTIEGEVIPCTLENKKKLIEGSPKFSRWLDRCLDKLSDTLENAKDEDLGN